MNSHLEANESVRCGDSSAIQVKNNVLSPKALMTLIAACVCACACVMCVVCMCCVCVNSVCVVCVCVVCVVCLCVCVCVLCCVCCVLCAISPRLVVWITIQNFADTQPGTVPSSP